MHTIIPFSTFHFQTAMNFLFLRLALVENAHHSSAAAETPLSIRPGGTSFRRAYLTAHSGSVPVRGAESGCLIPRDVDLLRQLLRLSLIHIYEAVLDRLIMDELRNTKGLYQQNWDALEQLIAQWTPCLLYTSIFAL